MHLKDKMENSENSYSIYGRGRADITIGIFVSIILHITILALIPYKIGNNAYKEKRDLIKVDLIKTEKGEEPLPEPAVKQREYTERPVRQKTYIMTQGILKEHEHANPVSKPLTAAASDTGTLILHENENIKEPVQIIEHEAGNIKQEVISAELQPMTAENITAKTTQSLNQVRDNITRLPEFIKKMEPIYPKSARKNNREGTVIVEASIDSEGRVTETKVVKGSGFGFDEAAVESINNSTFTPALAGERTIAVKIRIPFRFVLK